MEQERWQIINPGGMPGRKVPADAEKTERRLDRLEGKTVLLRWNGKHNGDLFLGRIGELMAERVKDVRIVKAWEVFPETGVITSNADRSRGFAEKLAGLNPDLSIGANGD